MPLESYKLYLLDPDFSIPKSTLYSRKRKLRDKNISNSVKEVIKKKNKVSVQN
jgi:hypothetical protein